jgi:hypothetical protein
VAIWAIAMRPGAKTRGANAQLLARGHMALSSVTWSPKIGASAHLANFWVFLPYNKYFLAVLMDFFSHYWEIWSPI